MRTSTKSTYHLRAEESVACVFLLAFFTNRSRIQRGLTHFNIFVLALNFGIFTCNFKISFVVYLCLSNHCSLTYNMPTRASIGSIWCTSDVKFIKDTDPIFFIKCINGWDPMAK